LLNKPNPDVSEEAIVENLFNYTVFKVFHHTIVTETDGTPDSSADSVDICDFCEEVWDDSPFESI